jgi:hypothetical protein
MLMMSIFLSNVYVGDSPTTLRISISSQSERKGETYAMTETLDTDWLISSGRGKPKYLSGIPHSHPRYVQPTLDVRARLVTLYPQLFISSAFIVVKRLTSLEKQIESAIS